MSRKKLHIGVPMESFTFKASRSDEFTYQFDNLDDFMQIVSDAHFSLERRHISGIIKSDKFYFWLEKIGEGRFASKVKEFSGDTLQVYVEAAKVLVENKGPQKLNFSAVVGMEETKKLLLEIATYPDSFLKISKQYGRLSSGCVLLYGPPGCGKTHLARALAGETSKYFIQRDLPSMAAASGTIFLVARRLGGAVLFIDELEALTQDRDSEGLSTRFMTNNLLSELNGSRENRGILFLGTTNEPWVMDTAMLRSGRLDNLVYVGVPDKKTRIELFRFYTRGLPMEKVDFDALADKTDFYSCSDIESICYEAAGLPWREALEGKKARRITKEDFDAALERSDSTAIPWFDEACNVHFSQSMKSRFKPMIKEIERYRRTKG